MKTLQNPLALAADLPASMSYLATDPREEARLKRAFWGAALVHLLALSIVVPAGPELVAAPEEKREPIRLQKFVFERPTPEPVIERPQQTPVKVPMPDPTPDDPEPEPLPEVDVPLPPAPDEDVVILPPAPPPPEPEPVVEGPVRVGGKITAPRCVHRVEPRYTEIARKARIQGPVILEATIDRDGSVINLRSLRGLPMGLTEEAIRAVSQWRYEPTLLGEQPVQVLMTVTVNYRLQ